MGKIFKLLNLKLANSSLIIQSLKKNTLSLVATVSQIKKVFKIIHSYHRSKKRIIFIGNPLYINKQLTTMLKKTRHLFVPKSAWIAGHIANRFTRSNMPHIENITKIFSIRKLKKKSDLVVIVDPEKEHVALKEHHSAKIPIISLNSKTDMLNEMSAYKVNAKLTSLKSDLNVFLFYSLLVSVLKATRTKKYKRYAQRIKKHRLRINQIIIKKYRSTYKQNFKQNKKHYPRKTHPVNLSPKSSKNKFQNTLNVKLSQKKK